MITPINGYVLLKLENTYIEKTQSGIIYDRAKQSKQGGIIYGHVSSISDEISKKYNFRVGDRVIVLKDNVETITFHSKEGVKFISLVLLVIKPENILAKIQEEKSVLDLLG